MKTNKAIKTHSANKAVNINKVVNVENISAALKVFSAKERKAMIKKEAYHGACARGFDAGDELSDWLAAEQRINAKLAQ